MKVIRFIQLMSMAAAIRPRLTNNKLLCRDCKHFIANDWECGKFGETNIITGKESFDSARSARSDEKKCGENAIMFEGEPGVPPTRRSFANTSYPPVVSHQQTSVPIVKPCRFPFSIHALAV